MTITITNFVGYLADMGITVSGDGDKLNLEGRTAALTPEIVAWLKTHKPAVLAMLRIRQSPVRRFVSLNGEAEAYSAHTLDSAYWREI